MPVVEVHGDEPEPHLAADIEELLAEDERVSEQGLQVHCRDRVVMVRGTVATRTRCDAIVEVLHERLPEHRIELDITVVAESLYEPVGEEHL